MYTHATTLRLRDTDAAGVLYFSRLFDLAHEAFESFMDEMGMGIGIILRTTHFDLPVVHAEAQYKKPIYPGEKLLIQIQLERLGETSFTLHYRLQDHDQAERGEVTLTHVVVDRKDGVKKAIPPELRAALSQLSGCS